MYSFVNSYFFGFVWKTCIELEHTDMEIAMLEDNMSRKPMQAC